MDTFECKVGTILICQCSIIELNEEEREYIRDQFSDCLCARCMNEMKSEFSSDSLAKKIRQLTDFKKGDK